MKNFLCLFGLALLTALNAHAAIVGTPFLPEEDSRYDLIENPASTAKVGSLKGEKGNSGSFVQHEAKGIFSIIGTAGTYTTPIVLPKNSVITQAFVFVEQAQLPSVNTVRLDCDASGDVLAAADESGVAANGFFSGVETGTAATMHYSSAGCTVKAVTNGTMTAGKYDLIVDYLIVK